jgi:hypothetical protein
MHTSTSRTLPFSVVTHPRTEGDKQVYPSEYMALIKIKSRFHARQFYMDAQPFHFLSVGCGVGVNLTNG